MESPPAGRPSVLIVDDDEHVAFLVKVLLEGDGMTVAVAHGSQEALEAAEASPPDVVIVDYHLPGFNGDELVGRLRGRKRTRDVRAVMLTAEIREDLREELAPKVDELMSKPFDLGGLLAAVNRLASQSPAAA